MTLSRYAGAAIFILALVPRLVWVLYQWTQHSGTVQFPDEELHWQIATNLIEHGNLISDDGRYAARMPGYPAFLALFAWLGTMGPLLARLAQALLGAATAWTGYAWLRQVGGLRAGLVAGTLIACDPYNVFFCNLLLTEVFFTLMAVGFAWTTWRLTARAHKTRFESAQNQSDSQKPRLAINVMFAVLGVTLVFLRPSAAGWVALVWLLVGLRSWNAQRSLQPIGIAIVAMTIAMTIWGTRNMLVLSAPALLSANGGVTLYDALGPQADGSSNQEFMEALPELANKSEIQRDTYLQQRALEQMRANPQRVMQLAFVKLARTWNPIPNYERYRGGAAAILGANYTLLLLVGFLLALRKLKTFRTLFLAILLPILYFTLLHMIYIGSVRYRIPLMPLLAIGCAINFAVWSRDAVKDSTTRDIELGNL